MATRMQIVRPPRTYRPSLRGPLHRRPSRARSVHTPIVEICHEHTASRLRNVDAGCDQRCILHLLRMELLHPAHDPRLAQLWPVLGVRRGALRRDVRLSAQPLSPFGLADVALPGGELAQPRRRPRTGDDVRLAGQPAFRALPHVELFADRRGLLAALPRLAPALPRPAARCGGGYRTLRPPI